MQRYILKRLVRSIIVILFMTIVVFLLARATGDPVELMLDAYATDEDRQMVRASLGLDKPLPQQYLVFLKNAVKGDFGNSLRMRWPALEVVLERFPATLQLGGAALLLSLLIGIPTGVMSAVRRDSIWDQMVKAFAVLGQSVPVFWLGLMLMLIFAVELNWLPVAGRGTPLHLILPAFTLGWFVTAGITRLTRSAMLDILDMEYVKLVRAKGLPERAVVWKHCLRNAAIPVVTFTGLMFVFLLHGSIVTETVFAWPGVGRLAYQAVMWRDFPLIQTIVVLVTVLFVTVNLLVDILYAYLDPRIRYQ